MTIDLSEMDKSRSRTKSTRLSRRLDGSPTRKSKGPSIVVTYVPMAVEAMEQDVSGVFRPIEEWEEDRKEVLRSLVKALAQAEIRARVNMADKSERDAQDENPVRRA
ncbi:MAG: hypothetical protein JWO25_1914 [Alphaproteobacteria bacterium]|nr:hypothetical protein [Alphaproteobacteria bacterium]